MKIKRLKFLFAVVFSRFYLIYFNIFKKNTFEVLILSKPHDIVLYRSNYLALELRKRNYNVKIIMTDKKNLFHLILLGKPKLYLSTKNIGTEAKRSYSRGIQMYNPKVVLQFDDMWNLSSFIKKYSNAKLVNIAHGVTDSTKYFNVIDYDYYFLYGQSSIDNLARNNKIEPGATTLVKTGPIFAEFNPSDSLSLYLRKYLLINDCWIKKVVYSSAFTKDLDVQELLVNTHKIIIDFAKKNTDILILVSLHPLEKELDFWGRYSYIKNIRILPSTVSKNEIAEVCDIHITRQSNTIIDYGLIGLDTLIIRDSDYGESYLNLSKYFSISNNSLELEETLKNYDIKSSKLDSFLKYHCEYNDLKSVNRVTDLLESLINGNKLEGIFFEVK